MQPINYARRRSRGGKQLLPPNPAQWESEHCGLDLRDDLKLDLACRLECERAFALLPNASVHPHGELPAADVFLEHFRKAGRKRRSVMAVTLPYGYELIVYNDS